MTVRSSGTLSRRSAGTARARLFRREDGAVTAEYAVTTVAACGFAGILYEVLKSDTVVSLIVKVISKALSWLL
jgi:hypothetical protein